MTTLDCTLVAPSTVSPRWARTLQETRPWAIVLAGGDGTRLRPLTRALAGDDRPKQFCTVIGNQTLLQQTTRRIGRLIPAERTLVVVNRHHAPYFDSYLANTNVFAQPENRGTAPAILYSLLSIGAKEPGAQVALFPSDHYVANGAKFMKHVSHALGAVRRRPDLIVLLGIVPDGPEIDYGWIQPGDSVRGANGSLRQVERFWEKPSQAVAIDLLSQGCLWNSFVIAGSVRALVGLIRNTVPELCEAFHDAQRFFAKAGTGEPVKSIYSKISPVDFSRQVLAQRPLSLTVLPVANAGWVDIGRPERVRKLLSAQAAGAG